MPYDIQLFIKKLLSDEPVNLHLYKEHIFCNEMQMYVLERIKFLLLDILRSHLPHEHVGSHEPFFLSEGIHTVDHNGLNLLDYCSIAGLDDVGCLFAKLGCNNTISVSNFRKRINENFSSDLPPSIIRINKALYDIEFDKQKYKDSPLDERQRFGDGTNPTTWQKIKYVIKHFPYKHHKFAILTLLFGLSCLIAAPFTGGLSTILLLSLGFPAILSGVGNLQGAVATLANYQQVEENSRVTHEAEMLRIMHKEICHQVKILSSNGKTKDDISMRITHNTHKINAKATTLLYLNSGHKQVNTNKKGHVKLKPPVGT